MREHSPEMQKQVSRAFLVMTGPADITQRNGKAKPLREQARRLLQKLHADQLRRRYQTAQACLSAALILWLAIPFLPSDSAFLDMGTIRACLYTLTVAVTVVGLLQAPAMCRPKPLIHEI
ncbi:hypothetical protein LO749_03980 [Paracoccus denitrificans]|uniref:hypothetical protein n=1 Tax=Paracoccus denitrificans TaxID=266 RepID=UPI001E5E1B9D|nr:hypothetical protein [Paracoccus denitrificans]UFS65727.1 hypothetical protein LO749_03980 [Paracoccus denitrificans]